MSTTAGAAQSDSLKANDAATKTGGDSVSSHVRQSAGLMSSDSVLACKQMTSGSGTAMNSFVGAHGDCTIDTKPTEQQTAQASPVGTREIQVQTTVGIDTQQAVAAA